jgi:hypothetical protein
VKPEISLPTVQYPKVLGTSIVKASSCYCLLNLLTLSSCYIFLFFFSQLLLLVLSFPVSFSPAKKGL